MPTFVRLAIIALFFSAGPATADQPWTIADLDAVADAAAESAAVDGKGPDAFRVVQLADALMRAGNGARAKAVLVKAMSALGPSTDIMNANRRGDFVERLAQLGDIADAEVLAAIDAQPSVKVMLLGKLGAGRAHAGDVAAAQNAAKAVTAISEANTATNATIATAAEFSLAGIGIALSDSGVPDEALHLAKAMPAGLQKLRVLAQAAYALCAGATKQTNGNIAEEAATTARSLPTVDAKPYERIIVPQTAAETIAVCSGADSAKTFIGETVPSDLAVQVLSKLADKLTNTQQIDLARAIAPPPDTTNAGDLLDSANRLKKQGDRPAATRLALAASRLAVGVQRDSAAPLFKWLDHTMLLGGIYATLAELGAYEDAIATVQPIEIQNRQQYYVNVVRAEVQNRDSAAIARTLPLAIAAIRQPTPAGRTANLMYELTRTLAVGGYSDEAKVAYQSLLELLGNHPATPQDRVQPWQLAVIKADMGDLPGALFDADNAGPMVTKPSPMQAVMLTAMQFGGARTKPSEAEVQAALQRSIAALPAFVAGPKASALSMIAVEMAVQGKIDAALQVATGLDVEPREVLQSVRNAGLAAIARAQERAGDLRGSFSTALQITQPQLRWDPLLKLAAQPAKQ
jgi:hypothetical protein